VFQGKEEALLLHQKWSKRYQRSTKNKKKKGDDLMLPELLREAATEGVKEGKGNIKTALADLNPYSRDQGIVYPKRPSGHGYDRKRAGVENLPLLKACANSAGGIGVQIGGKRTEVTAVRRRERRQLTVEVSQN